MVIDHSFHNRIYMHTYAFYSMHIVIVGAIIIIITLKYRINAGGGGWE